MEATGQKLMWILRNQGNRAWYTSEMRHSDEAEALVVKYQYREITFEAFKQAYLEETGEVVPEYVRFIGKPGVVTEEVIEWARRQ